MSKPRIYISGRITGNDNAYIEFSECEKYLSKEGLYIPINPIVEVGKIISENKIQNPTWKDYMRIAIRLMIDFECEDIIMLEDFYKSKGALLESKIAFGLEYRTHYFINGERIFPC